MKQLFKGVLHTNCSQNFGKFSRKYPWSGLFHRERAPNEYFPNNFLISLRAPLEFFYCSTINKIQIKGK